MHPQLAVVVIVEFFVAIGGSDSGARKIVHATDIFSVGIQVINDLVSVKILLDAEREIVLWLVRIHRVGHGIAGTYPFFFGHPDEISSRTQYLISEIIDIGD